MGKQGQQEPGDKTDPKKEDPKKDETTEIVLDPIPAEDSEGRPMYATEMAEFFEGEGRVHYLVASKNVKIRFLEQQVAARDRLILALKANLPKDEAQEPVPDDKPGD